MTQTESGAEFALDTRVDFLHSLRGVAELSKMMDTEGQRRLGLRACYLLFNQGLGLLISENDLPNAETRAQRDLFILDAYQAAQARTDLRADLQRSDIYGGRQFIIEQFYADMMEIVDRALLRYEKIMRSLT